MGFFIGGICVMMVHFMREIHEIDTLEAYLERKHKLRDCVVQGLNLGDVDMDWDLVEVSGAIFLGCRFPSLAFQERLREGGALVFPRLPRLPYEVYRPALYTRDELADGWTEEIDLSIDKKIYEHFVKQGRHNTHILEALAQRLHDFSIDDALGDLLSGRVEPGGPKKVVAIMGGHSTARTDPWFRVVAEIARDLTRKGYFIASGGGPGMMEAANLGAWVANAPDGMLDEAIEIMKVAPRYLDHGYIQTAETVRKRHPDGSSSLAIPTWFYGHEPSNAFSTWIAKYFSNSIREDGLLSIAEYGVIFSPGSAGTVQEIFQDATQNHYGTFGQVSPMVFLNKSHYTQSGIFPTLKKLAGDRQYSGFISMADDPAEVVSFIESHPPVLFQDKKPLPVPS
ncbi:MAG: hypothetical protein P1U89_09560 [Verrucomicrobiales bacterium]|nr:hypothetical protein [Verrucomicrobiales bacterium]